jgi:outer membrane lipoprotein-sorting protein
MGDWHAVWQIEWDGAPVRGPLVIEVWHAADGRWRVETLEAPSAALSGLTLVNDGETSYLYDLRRDQVKAGSNKEVRIPLAGDALDTIEWLILGAEHLSAATAGRDTLESGVATRVDIELNTGGRATLWVNGATGLPAQVKLRSAVRGEATFATRSIDVPEQLPSALFTLP